MSSRPDLSGYHQPYRFEYPALWLQVGGAVLFVLALGGFLTLAAGLRGGEVAIVFDSSEFLVFVLALLVTIIVHEAIHGAVARLLGYHVTYGVAWSVLGVYTASFGQLISRRDNVLVAGAPLVALTGVGVVILPFVDETLLAAVLVGLVANTASAVGDLYVLYRLVRMPRGSMLYDVSIEEMLVYEPSSASAVGHAE